MAGIDTGSHKIYAVTRPRVLEWGNRLRPKVLQKVAGTYKNIICLGHINPLTPTVATRIQLWSILCQTRTNCQYQLFSPLTPTIAIWVQL